MVKPKQPRSKKPKRNWPESKYADPKVRRVLRETATLPFYNALRKLIRRIQNKEYVTMKQPAGTRIIYSKAYEAIAKPGKLEGKRIKRITRRGTPTKDGTVAKHNVYKIDYTNHGKRTYFKVYQTVNLRAHTALSEALAMMEAKERGVPVVEVIRIDINAVADRAAITTLAPKEFNSIMDAIEHRYFASIPPHKIREFLGSLGDMVGKMHKAGVCHGDLDPENILWNGKTGAAKFKLIDFEHARIFKKQPSFSSVAKDVVNLALWLIKAPTIPGTFTKKEFKSFVNTYSTVTGYPRELIWKAIERKIPVREGERVRNLLRERPLRNAGLDE